MAKKPLILVTNDDGISAPGIRTLISVMNEIGDVVVVAPDSPQSAMGHAITINSTLQCHKIKIDDGPQEEYTCSGTPADCVKLGINEILNKLPKNIIMVLDGAYAEYVTKDDYDNGFSLVDQFENLIITRTFSKAYGLAGLRLGWCYTSKKVATILNKVKGPFNTQSLSQEMAIIALEDKNYLNQIVKNNQEVKDWFENELKKINIKTNPSEGNFTFVEMTEVEVKNISAHLANMEIIVRELDSYGLPNCLRITIGTKEEMEATIHALKQI